MENVSNIQQADARRATSASILSAAFGFLGGALAVGTLGFLAKIIGVPILIAPFGASCVLIFATPESAFAQPRNVLFGHIFSAAIGLAVYAIADAGVWQMAIAVGIAIGVMQLTRTVHPPAGADPLVILLAGGASVHFLFIPILAGVLCLLAIAWIFNNLVRRQQWSIIRGTSHR
ncbi:CBS-domain-containing membrane protein [Paraburkholderia fungorum]|jgi:CBS-domain-containing membrane protein|uniref:HPP family protein n=2 Tax=Bacteria TaxID=2 RepID=UPI00160F059B|nr:HPP family protein [Paraburkholderia fungorum]MBB4519706.1 CBS-domain-containing membrane protein [Paraburkholderia fungorum]